MKNKFYKILLMLGASAFTFLAFSTSASACVWGTYQPEEPECLRQK